MYTLDRTQKVKIITICLCIAFFGLTVVGYLGGGYEILKYGFMNEVFYSIMMIVCFACGIMLLLLSVLINAIQNDLSEHLKYLDSKGSEPFEK